MMMGILADKTPSQGAAGTVTVNATGTKGYQGTNTTSFNYTGLTIAAGSNIGLVVSLVWDTSGGPTSGTALTWDSGGTNQSMTQIVSQVGLGGDGAELWGLVNPTTGNKTLAISWTTNSRLFVVGMAFNGVNQSGGATSFPNSTGNSGVATVTVTSAVGNIVMATGESGSALGVITGTTIYSDSSSGTVVNAYANYDNGAVSVVIGQSNNNNQICATDIKAA